MVDFPEHEKLAQIQHLSQAVGQFIEWLGTKHYFIAKSNGPPWEDAYVVRQSRESMLAEFFGIDLTKLEAEKMQMIEIMQEATRALSAGSA